MRQRSLIPKDDVKGRTPFYWQFLIRKYSSLQRLKSSSIVRMLATTDHLRILKFVWVGLGDFLSNQRCDWIYLTRKAQQIVVELGTVCVKGVSRDTWLDRFPSWNLTHLHNGNPLPEHKMIQQKEKGFASWRNEAVYNNGSFKCKLVIAFRT